MKKILLVIIVILSLGLLVGCDTTERIRVDGKKFYLVYESDEFKIYQHEQNSTTVVISEVRLYEDDEYIYTADEVVLNRTRIEVNNVIYEIQEVIDDEIVQFDKIKSIQSLNITLSLK